MYNFDPYNVLLAIATNIAVLLMTAFVLQGHILLTIFFTIAKIPKFSFLLFCPAFPKNKITKQLFDFT